MSGWPSGRYKLYTKLEDILKTEKHFGATNSLALGLAATSQHFLAIFGSICGVFETWLVVHLANQSERASSAKKGSQRAAISEFIA